MEELTFYEYLIEQGFMDRPSIEDSMTGNDGYVQACPMLWESYGSSYMNYCKINNYTYENLNYLNRRR